ncbi:putative Pentatricopeptide repeat-containing protein [Quillaja saponaria]|uniref:Pentatricopeptide repeat-containing protein n=1 Tax=Quillaja saponaria TaxID=32244 RepID=A0AAD7VNX5_QUISA|nr:putative Pentatricopeptide repeat-containing protein [Quillaja saponaria]
MEIPNLFKKLRYLSEPHISYFRFFHSQVSSLSPETLASTKASHSLYHNFNSFHTGSSSNITLNSFTSLTGNSSVFPVTYPNFIGDDRNVHMRFRLFSASTNVSSASSLLEKVSSAQNPQFANLGNNEFRPYANQIPVSEIIDMIKRDGSDLESKLNSMDICLSRSSIIQIFRVLSFERVPLLRFFDWIKGSQPHLSNNSEICNLVIANCGRLGNYDAMHGILTDFKLKQIPMTPKAFGFIPCLSSNKDLITDSVKKVIKVLNEVGGSCQASGVHSLIEMFSNFGSFDAAEYVIEITRKEVSRYNVLIREMCKRYDFERARSLLSKMKQQGCDPNASTYNYVLSSLCKNEKIGEAYEVLEDMRNIEVSPDALSFDILVNHFCRNGRFDLALQFIDNMVSDGVEPRISTHAAIIKAFFKSMKYEEAYKYVVDADTKHNSSSNANYSLLASLHQRKGNVNKALKILYEMIEKGLKPYFPVYMRVWKHLQKTGKESLALDLKSRFSSVN